MRLHSLILGLALGLVLPAGAVSAEPARHPLLGASPDQVRRQLGEPRSQIAVQDRLVWLYARERLTLRGGVVVEVEAVMVPGMGTASAASPGNGALGAARPVVAAPTAATSVAPAAPAPAETAPAVKPVQPEAPDQGVVPAAPAAAAPGKVEIKAIRPPGASQPILTAPVKRPSPPAATPASAAPVPAASSAVARSAPSPAPLPAAPAMAPAATSAPAASAVAPVPAVGEDEIFRQRAAAEQAKAEKLAAEAQVREMKARALAAARRRMEEARAQQLEDGIIPPRVVMGLAGVTLAAFVWLGWRWRQRRLALAASSVESSPVPGGARGGVPVPEPSPTFSAEFVAGLTPHQFEHLVAEYFNRTGVVALHLKPGRGAVAQIRISWKGDAKPFAGVFCIAAPAGPIEAKALMPFLAELETEEITRGHVVTTGAFSAGARHLAEERSLTLLGGDSLLEKLNALPESARREIRRTLQAPPRVL